MSDTGHGMSVDYVGRGPVYQWRANCTCGWQSDGHWTATQAWKSIEAHTSKARNND